MEIRLWLGEMRVLVGGEIVLVEMRLWLGGDEGVSGDEVLGV